MFCLNLLFVFGFVFAVQTTKPKAQEETNESADIKAIIDDAIDYALNISLTFLENNPNGSAIHIAPFSLFPTPFPQNLFELAQKVQKAFNLMYFRISNDFDFLVETFEPVAKTNEKIRRMLNILKQTHAEGLKQTKSVVLARSDYMCNVITNKENNEKKYELKQIEMNAGQIGGISVSGRVTKVHRRTLWKASLKATKDQMPDNDVGLGVSEVLYQAWLAFNNPNAILLIIPGFRYIEYEIERLSKGKIKIVRMSLQECGEMSKAGRLILNPDDFSLQLDGRTVGVIYRISEPPKNTETEWKAQLLFERSTAILSPTIGLGLATQKKIQQILAKPGMVERFLHDQLEIVPFVRSTFAGLWSLDGRDEDSQRAIKDAIEHPENYVIKPNMEGGGHNFFNEQVRKKLLNFTEDEKEAHILMQKLNPMIVKNHMVFGFQKKTPFGNVTTELGIFGFLLGDSRGDNELLHNVQKGHFLRTKIASANEGGVSLGTGVFDSPFLVQL